MTEHLDTYMALNRNIAFVLRKLEFTLQPYDREIGDYDNIVVATKDLITKGLRTSDPVIFTCEILEHYISGPNGHLRHTAHVSAEFQVYTQYSRDFLDITACFTQLGFSTYENLSVEDLDLVSELIKFEFLILTGTLAAGYQSKTNKKLPDDELITLSTVQQHKVLNDLLQKICENQHQKENSFSIKKYSIASSFSSAFLFMLDVEDVNSGTIYQFVLPLQGARFNTYSGSIDLIAESWVLRNEHLESKGCECLHLLDFLQSISLFLGSVKLLDDLQKRLVSQGLPPFSTILVISRVSNGAYGSCIGSVKLELSYFECKLDIFVKSVIKANDTLNDIQISVIWADTSESKISSLSWIDFPQKLQATLLSNMTY